MSPVHCLFVCGGRIKLSLGFVSQDDAEAARLKEERLAEYAAKKSKSTLPTKHDLIDPSQY